MLTLASSEGPLGHILTFINDPYLLIHTCFLPPSLQRYIRYLISDCSGLRDKAVAAFGKKVITASEGKNSSMVKMLPLDTEKPVSKRVRVQPCVLSKITI